MHYSYRFLLVLGILCVHDDAGAIIVPDVGAVASVHGTTETQIPRISGASLNATRNIQLGYQALQQNRYSDALGYLDEAVKIDPAPVALTLRGEVRVALGRSDAAIDDFTRALSKDSRFLGALLARAALYSKLDKSDLALDDYSEALAIDPRSSDAYISRGLIFHDMHKQGQAANDFERAGQLLAVKNNVTGAEWFKVAALGYDLVHRKSDALRCINTAIGLTPDRGDVYAMRGDMEKNQIGMGKALLDYETALRLNPNDTSARDSLAVMLEDMGQYQASMNEFDVIFRTPQNDESLYLDHANLMMDMGRDEDAQKDYEIAGKLQPTSARVVHQRMQLRFYQGDYAAAVEDADIWLSTKGKTDSETNVAYTLLWRHISMQRQGIDDRDYMVKAMVNLKNRSEWPYPLMEYSIGNLGEKQLEDAALHGAPEKLPQRECEAAAYIGERYLSQNRLGNAEDKFRRALAICPFGFIERTLAAHELRNIAAGTATRRTPQ